MTTLVIDVAAQFGGAATILEQYIETFKKDKNNDYIVILSTLHFEDTDNVKFVNCEWVKKSHIHRLFFDNFYIKKLVKDYKPDSIFSLQNKTVNIKNIPQEVYFHNALPISDKKFKLSESKSLWMYQNIIGSIVKKSLYRATRIYVQADWIKHALVNKWGIDENIILVKRPQINVPSFIHENTFELNEKALFYPANGSLYKNHSALLQACTSIWNSSDKKFSLYLTGEIENLPQDCKKIIMGNEYPIVFVGRIPHEEMYEYYRKYTLIFPSYLETVGLPLIEAKSQNGRILSSNCDYAIEAIGKYDKVDYFDPFSIDSIRQIIEKWLME